MQRGETRLYPPEIKKAPLEVVASVRRANELAQKQAELYSLMENSEGESLRYLVRKWEVLEAEREDETRKVREWYRGER